jgi:hypothetical protein
MGAPRREGREGAEYVGYFGGAGLTRGVGHRLWSRHGSGLSCAQAWVARVGVRAAQAAL